MHIKKYLIYAAAMLVLLGCANVNYLKSQISKSISPGMPSPASDRLVNESLKTLDVIKNRKDMQNFLPILRDSAGIAIFPAIYKAGFFVGAEGGNGVFIARNTEGTWGYPAFYTLAGGSWGLQFGGQRAGVVLVMRSRKSVEAVLKHQTKVGVDFALAIGSVGIGMEGSTTTNLKADIIAFSDAKGLFSGISLEGTALVRRNDLNREYYGSDVTPVSILIKQTHQNAQADPLRRALNVQ